MFSVFSFLSVFVLVSFFFRLLYVVLLRRFPAWGPAGEIDKKVIFLIFSEGEPCVSRPRDIFGT